MSTDIVTISNKSYSISQLPGDRSRRRKYFNTFKVDAAAAVNAAKPEKSTNAANTQTEREIALTKEESQLLTDLGMDSKMINVLKMYLPTFFDNLQTCSSDSSLILKKNCNISQYVLWSIMIANKELTDKRIRQNKLKYSPPTQQLNVAMNTAMIHQMRPKKITNQYDKLFQLILINSAPEPETQEKRDAFASLLSLRTSPEQKKPEANLDAEPTSEPELEPEPEPEPESKSKPKPKPEDEKVNKLFALILLSKAGAEPVDNLCEELKTLVRERKSPLYTFSQMGSTCATDSLFTILLQADKIKDIIINNCEFLYKDDMDAALKNAMQRYVNMLELEATHAPSETKRRNSINLSHGVSKSELCIGASRENIIEYLTKLKTYLLSKKVLEANNLNFFYGYDKIKDKYKTNLNKIKGFYITHRPEIDIMTDGKSGHAISILKINNVWYISDNEHGMLHKITDEKFIKLLFYKLYNSKKEDDLLFQMWYFKERNSTENLTYYFVFTYPSKANPAQDVTYTYPPFPPTTDLQTLKIPEVTSQRIIALTYEYTNDIEERDALLDGFVENGEQIE
jgi:hypothetical protein